MTAFWVRYFNDYNTLESTFLICGIMVLLGGIGYSVAEFSMPIYYDLLEYIVLLIVVASTIICAITILNELMQSIRYFALATQANRRMKVTFSGWLETLPRVASFPDFLAGCLTACLPGLFGLIRRTPRVLSRSSR